jgi:organic radical activating enzyme
MNNSYADKHWKVVESTKDDGTVDDLNLIHWDFRFSNICNQSCRTCGIEFSSQWHGDYIKLWNLGPDKQPEKIKKIWRDVDAFEQDFEELFDKVEYIHFAGGEPLITDEHYKVLERLIDRGRTDITIRYSTNFNQLQYKKYDVVEMWKHFKHIQLIASLDDCGDRYNYIRNGGGWKEVVENFK